MDKTIYYDEKCSRHPAVKHFNHPTKSQLHYLLVIGGVDQDTKVVSKKVQVFLVSIDQLEDDEEEKVNVALDFKQNDLIIGDYFP